MNDEMIKDMLKLKISLVRKVVERLPEPVQKPAKELETQMMRILYEISKEYVDKSPNGENIKQTGGLKVIDVE